MRPTDRVLSFASGATRTAIALVSEISALLHPNRPPTGDLDQWADAARHDAIRTSVTPRTPRSCEADEVEVILTRAQRAGIDPRRVAVALGLDTREFK